MGDNQVQNQQNEVKESASTSLSAATSSPSRKRLLAFPNPKQATAAASPESSISSDSLSDRFRKKTRESLNLSNCHGCGLRINYSNPKERLQTLESVWRIVLLCKKCFKRVNSAEICSYCFSGPCDEGCFRCRDCKRCIHNDCVVKFGRFPPWSYCRSESRFSVCVDCWVPKLLVKSTRVYTRRKNDSKKSVCSAGDSRVSVNSNNCPKLLQDAVKDASFVLEKKIVVANKAKEDALRKAVVAKSAVELASGAVQLVAKKDENRSSCTTTADVDDAELAFRLHRAMNSSPRISKNICLLNSSCLAVPNSRVFKGNVPARSAECRGSLDNSVCGKPVVYSNDKLNERIERTVSEPSVCLRVSDLGSSIDLGNFIRGEMTDNREIGNRKEPQYNGEIGLAEVLAGECHYVDHNRMNFESADMRNQELHSNESGTQGSQKCNGNSNMLCDGGCNGKRDRYLLKYSKRGDRNRTILRDRRCNRKPDRYRLKYKKRPVNSKANSNTETKFYHGSLHFENKASAQKCDGNSNMLYDGRCNDKPDRYLLKYSKRPISSKQPQSCPVHVQAFACGSS